MNLKPTLLVAAVALACGGMAFAPQAARAASNPGPDGTINITGTVVAQTCTVDGNAAGSADNKSVTLPNVFTSNLASTGAVAGKTSFSVTVAGCDKSLNNVQAFWSGANIDTSTGNLDNTASSGSNVQVQLLNASGTAMPLNGADATAQGSQVVNLDSTGGATLNYAARYVAASAPATAGAVSTSVDFTLIYQ